VGPPPRIVLLITVDQLRADYLTRFRAQWTGGFARLLAHGAVFTAARQDHAITETAPGHATLLSGRYSASTGIVSNTLGVPDSSSPLVGSGSGEGASPFRFRGTTLVDWLRARDSATRVLSISGKDRGAILPIGRTRGQVFWLVAGRFVTSRYYADSLPGWVERWNARSGPDHYAGREWPLLEPASRYGEPDSMAYENDGKDIVFPHHTPEDPGRAARNLPEFPWLDSLTLDLALEGVQRLALGKRSGTDVIAVSLSSTDYIGHTYGPDSREIHDQLLRLDRSLGWFLDSLDVLEGPGRTLVVLTADHGVTTYPELSALRGRPGGRVSARGAIRASRALLRRAIGTDPGVSFESGLLWADPALPAAAGPRLDGLADSLSPIWQALPGVARVYTHRTLAAAPLGDEDAVRWRRALPPDFGWLLCVSVASGYIWAEDAGSTTHGTTTEDDVTVPIVLLGPGIRPGQYQRHISTVDIAPTLALLLDVKPLEHLDGQVVTEALNGR
jgi:hypothetical protein